LFEKGEIGLEFDAEFVKAKATRQLLHTAWICTTRTGQLSPTLDHIHSSLVTTPSLLNRLKDLANLRAASSPSPQSLAYWCKLPKPSHPSTSTGHLRGRSAGDLVCPRRPGSSVLSRNP
jgi:hypothetical protein